MLYYNIDSFIYLLFREVFDPAFWNDSAAYRIPLKHCKLKELNCRLEAIPVGDVMILNISSINNNIKSRSIVIECYKHFNPYSSDISGKFMNTKIFSHR